MPYASALEHPIVKATLAIVQRVRERPVKEWSQAIETEMQQIRRMFNRAEAETIHYGIRSHLKLVDERMCNQRAGDCQCQEKPGHQSQHRCACGKVWGLNLAVVPKAMTKAAWRKYRALARVRKQTKPA